MDGLEWKTLLKWMIWGYPYFRNHANSCTFQTCFFTRPLYYMMNLYIPHGQSKWHSPQNVG